MIIHGAHNSDTSDLYKNGKHVSKVIRNGKTIWQSGTYALLYNGAIGKLCKGHIDMVGPSGNVYVRDGSVYAREGADEYRITSTGDWPHGGADGDWPHSGDYICNLVHAEYATGENWHLYPDEAAKNMVFIQFPGELCSFQCTGNKTGTLKSFSRVGDGNPKLNWKKIVYGKFDGTTSSCGYALAENGDLYKILLDEVYSSFGQMCCAFMKSGVKDVTSVNGTHLYMTDDGIRDDYDAVQARFIRGYSPNSFTNSGFSYDKRGSSDHYWYFNPNDRKQIYIFSWAISSTVDQTGNSTSSGSSWHTLTIDLPEKGTLLTGHSEKNSFFAVAGGKLYEYDHRNSTSISCRFDPVTLTGTEGLTQITDIVWDGTYGYLINDGKLYSFTHGGNPVLLDDTHVWEKVYTAGIAVAKS